MKAMTFSLPQGIIDTLSALKNTGIYSSRSEVIRFAIFEFFGSGGHLPEEPKVERTRKRRKGLNSEPIVPRKENEKRKIMSTSLPPAIIAKMDEFIMLDESQGLVEGQRSKLMLRILKGWLPHAIKLTDSILEPASVSTPARSNKKAKTPFDLRSPQSRKIIEQMLSNLTIT